MMKKKIKDKIEYSEDPKDPDYSIPEDYTSYDFIADMMAIGGGLKSFEVELLQDFILKLAEHHKNHLEEITVMELERGIVHWKKVYGDQIWGKYQTNASDKKSKH